MSYDFIFVTLICNLSNVGVLPSFQCTVGMDLSVVVVRRNNLPVFVQHPPKKRGKNRKNRGRKKQSANGREDNEEGDEDGDELDESEDTNAFNEELRPQVGDISEASTTAPKISATGERLDMSEGREGGDDDNEDAGESEVELIFGTADEDDEEEKDVDDEATSATSYASAEGSPLGSGSPQSSHKAQMPDLGSPLKRSRR